MRIPSAESESKLFQSLQLKGLQIRNRIGLAPMSRLASCDGVAREDTVDLLIKRAGAGVGLIYTEAIVVDDWIAPGYLGQTLLRDSRHQQVWARLIPKIHEAGAVCIAQLNHCGRVSRPELNRAARVIAPSRIAATGTERSTGLAYPTPESMVITDFDQVLESFSRTAEAAAQLGFDGVEVHAAHGYLLSQFLSAMSNLRADSYGGNIRNRCRFVQKVIATVRSVFSSQGLVTLRISDWSVTDTGRQLFEDAQEYKEVIEELAREEIDAISVSTKRYADSALGSQRTLLDLTREVWSGPIFASGGIYNRESAERALHKADVVLIGKSLLLNPNWLDYIGSSWPLKEFSGTQAGVAYGEYVLL